MTYDTAQVNHLMRHRRSVQPQHFSGQQVPRYIVEQLLENANWAPTHGLTQPWRFFVFAGEGLQKFAQLQAQLYKEVTPAEKFAQATFDKLSTNPLKASHIIGIAMKRQEVEKIPEIEEIEAVACAVQNIYLSATAYGLCGYWGSGGVTYREELKEHFGLGPKDKILGFFYLGYPAQAAPDGQRTPIEEKVTWIEE